MSRYIHDKINHELIPISGYGSRVATSIDDKKLIVHSSFVNIDGYNYGKADITDAVELIAPIESTLVASRNYTVGKQFVYNGFLYEVTAPIALDDPIVIGTNCELASSVSEQLRNLSSFAQYSEVSYVPPYQYNAYQRFYFRKIGKTVIATGCILNSSCPVGQQVTLFTITDSNFWPRYAVSQNLIDNNNGIIGGLYITTAGEVSIYLFTSSANIFRGNANPVVYFTN